MRERVLTKHALHDWLLIRILSRAMHNRLLLLLATNLFIVLHECLDHKRYIFRIRVHLHGTLKFGCNLWVLLSHILQLRKRQYLCNNRVHLARLLLLLLLHLLRWLLWLTLRWINDIVLLEDKAAIGTRGLLVYHRRFPWEVLLHLKYWLTVENLILRSLSLRILARQVQARHLLMCVELVIEIMLRARIIELNRVLVRMHMPHCPVRVCC